jgi:hypothetical protein
MNCRDRELRLGEILADPIVQAIMAADGVDPQRLLASLRKTAAKVAQQMHERESGVFERREDTTDSMVRGPDASRIPHSLRGQEMAAPGEAPFDEKDACHD